MHAFAGFYGKQVSHEVVYNFIYQLNGSIKIYKKYINKYNTTKKDRKEEKTRSRYLIWRL